MDNISPNASPWLILLAFTIYSVVHSLLASQTAKDFASSFFGRSADRGYRLFFNIFGTLTLLPIMALPAILPDNPLYAIRSPWSYLAFTIQGIAVVLLIIALLQTDAMDFIGLQQLFSNPDKNTPKLVISGFYKWVRHPLYTAGLLFIWFTPTMTWNLMALYVSFTLYIVIGSVFEERKLVKEFGEEYVVYQARTPMLIPWKTRQL